MNARRGTWLLCAVLLVLGGSRPGGAADAPSTAELDRLEEPVTRAEDVEAIKRLTFIFGYYREKFLDRDAMSLFSEDAVADFAGGKYIEKTSIARLMQNEGYRMTKTRGREGPQYGILSAKARFKEWTMQAVHGRSQTRSAGVYENEYVKDDGVWKISAMAYCLRYSNPYLTNPRDIETPVDAPATPRFFPLDPLGPDRQSNHACHSWPHPGIAPPLHYPYPVDGDYIHKP